MHEWVSEWVRECLIYRPFPPRHQIIFVIGGPGSGKGTQCSLIHEKYGHSHISAGDLLRAERKKGGELGDMINSIIQEGKIVPSEITTTLLLNAIQECDNNKFLIDGFPRGSPNLTAWNDLVPSNVEVPFLLHLQCPDAVMTERLLERGKTSGRSDDNEETIKKRLATDAEITQPVIDYFKSIGKLRVVDANRPINDVFSDIKIHFDNANAH